MKNRLLSAGFCALWLVLSQESQASAISAEGGAADPTAGAQGKKPPTFASLLQTSETFNRDITLLGEDRTALYYRLVEQASTLSQFLSFLALSPKSRLRVSLKMIGRTKALELLANLNRASQNIPHTHQQTFSFTNFKDFKNLTFENFFDVEYLIPDAYRATYDARSHYPVETKKSIQEALLKIFQEQIQHPLQKLVDQIIADNGFLFLTSQKTPDPLPATDVLLDIHQKQLAMYDKLYPFIQQFRAAQIDSVRKIKAFMKLYNLEITATFDDNPDTPISPTLIKQGKEWIANLLPTLTPVLYHNGIKIRNTVAVNNLEHLLFRDLLQRVMTIMTDFFQTSDPTRIDWALLGLSDLAQGYFNLQTPSPAQKQKSLDSAIMTSPHVKTASNLQCYVEAQLQLAATLKGMEAVFSERLAQETDLINRHLNQAHFGVSHQPTSAEPSQSTPSVIQDDAAQASQSLSPEKDLAFLLRQPFSLVAIAVTNKEARRALHQRAIDLQKALQQCRTYWTDPTELSSLGYRFFIHWFLNTNPDFLETINKESQKVAYAFMYREQTFNLTIDSIIRLYSLSTLYTGLPFETIESVLPSYVQHTYHPDTDYSSGGHKPHDYIKKSIITFFDNSIMTPLQKAWMEFQELVGLASGRQVLPTANTEKFLHITTIQGQLLDSIRLPLQSLRDGHVREFNAFQPFLEEEGLSVLLPFEASPTANLTLEILGQGDAYIKQACQILSTALYNRANIMRTHPLLTEFSILNPKTKILFSTVMEHYGMPITQEGFDFGNPQAPAYTAVPWEILGLDGLAHSCWAPRTVTPAPQVKGKPAFLSLPAPERKTPIIDDPALLLRHLTGQHAAARVLNGMTSAIETDVQGQRAAIATIFAGPALGYVDPLKLTEGDTEVEIDVDPAAAAPAHRAPTDDGNKDPLDL